MIICLKEQEIKPYIVNANKGKPTYVHLKSTFKTKHQ